RTWLVQDVSPSFPRWCYTAAMPQFTHRPAFPDQPDSHAEHRIVVYDGVIVGTVTRELTAHRGTVWRWNAMSEVKHSKGGEVQTFEEALPLIKAAVLESMEQWPDLLEEKRAFQKRGRDATNHWLRLHGKPEREI